MRHAARDLDAGLRHVGELDRVVRVRPHRLGEVDADLALDHVERGHELDVADVVAAEVRRASGPGRTGRRRRPCSRSLPGGASWRSCRRRSGRRGPCPRRGPRRSTRRC